MEDGLTGEGYTNTEVLGLPIGLLKRLERTLGMERMAQGGERSVEDKRMLSADGVQPATYNSQR